MMAGEIDDRSAFQAECLSSGSISFGRFEVEPLSWEKRSSFSHNRYLEEVEKYSKPGSVNKKKAYFEAHFKKKGLLHQNSFLYQNGSESQKNIYNEDHANYMDEYEDNSNDQIHFGEFQNPANDGVEFSWYDDTPVLSGELEHDMTDGEGEESSFSQIQVGQTMSKEITLEANNQNVEHAGKVETQVFSALPLVNKVFQIEKEKEIGRKVETADNIYETKEMPSSSTIVEAGHAPVLQKSQRSSKKEVEKAIGEHKRTKFTIGSTRPPQMSSTDNKHLPSVRESTRTLKKDKKDGFLFAKSEKHMHLRNLPSQTMNSIKKTIKNEVSGNKVKGRVEHKSMVDREKDPKEKKVAMLHRSTPARQSGIRYKETTTSVKARPKAAEKKNEVKAKPQEDIEVAMKQFRKSLNFKATTLPSVHHEPGQKVSILKKGVAVAKSQCQRSSRMNAGTKIVGQGSSRKLVQDGSSYPSNSKSPENMSRLGRLSSIKHCSASVIEVAAEKLHKREGGVDIKVVPGQCGRVEVGRKESKIRQRQRENHMVKKEERSRKV